MDRQQRHRWLFTGVNVIAIGLMLYVASRFAATYASEEVHYSEFLTELRAGNLTDVQITEHELIGISKSKSDAFKSQPAQNVNDQSNQAAWRR